MAVFVVVACVWRRRGGVAPMAWRPAQVDVARRPAAAHREGRRAEDLADDALEIVGRQIRRGGLELHALVWRPYEGLRTLGGHFDQFLNVRRRVDPWEFKIYRRLG